MRIVIEIEDGGVRSARVSTDGAASPQSGEYIVGAPGATDLAAMQLRGTNAGPAPTRGTATTAAAVLTGPGDAAALPSEDYGGAQAAGAAPNA